MELHVWGKSLDFRKECGGIIGLLEIGFDTQLH
jgi:hypothetical protein